MRTSDLVHPTWLKLVFVMERIDDQPELFRIEYDFHYFGLEVSNQSVGNGSGDHGTPL